MASPHIKVALCLSVSGALMILAPHLAGFYHLSTVPVSCLGVVFYITYFILKLIQNVSLHPRERDHDDAGFITFSNLI